MLQATEVSVEDEMAPRSYVHITLKAASGIIVD